VIVSAVIPDDVHILSHDEIGTGMLAPAMCAIGDRWLRSMTSAVLRVPSAVVPAERNFLLNPEHSAFGKIIAEPAEPFYYASSAKPGYSATA
jgi:RES domain-containing protein